MPRQYYQDPRSGALVTIFQAISRTPSYTRYAVPRESPAPVQVSVFDFEDERQPFIWTNDEHALPFPKHRDSGYALGYDGSGPQAIKAMAAVLLGLNKAAPIGPRWPFYREGYPTQITADEM